MFNHLSVTLTLFSQLTYLSVWLATSSASFSPLSDLIVLLAVWSWSSSSSKSRLCLSVNFLSTLTSPFDFCSRALSSSSRWRASRCALPRSSNWSLLFFTIYKYRDLFLLFIQKITQSGAVWTFSDECINSLYFFVIMTAPQKTSEK